VSAVALMTTLLFCAESRIIGLCGQATCMQPIVCKSRIVSK
jgi:hypothetical protein